MAKTLQGIWFEKKVLCPKCLVQPGQIHNYGIDRRGFWFKGRCPHCSSVIKWYRNTDLSVRKELPGVGEQLSLFHDYEVNYAYQGKKKRK